MDGKGQKRKISHATNRMNDSSLRIPHRHIRAHRIDPDPFSNGLYLYSRDGQSGPGTRTKMFLTGTLTQNLFLKGPGPKTVFRRDRNRYEIFFLTGTGTKNDWSRSCLLYSDFSFLSFSSYHTTKVLKNLPKKGLNIFFR
jgi:hypothetical protein